MMAYHSSPILNDTYKDTAWDFGADGSNTFSYKSPGARARNIAKNIRVEFAIGAKTNSGNIRAYLAQRYTDPLTGALSWAPVPCSISVPTTAGQALVVRENTGGSNTNLAAGRFAGNAIAVSVVENDRFIIETLAPVLGPVELRLEADAAATLKFAFAIGVQQQTDFC